MTSISSRGAQRTEQPVQTSDVERNRRTGRTVRHQNINQGEICRAATIIGKKFLRKNRDNNNKKSFDFMQLRVIMAQQEQKRRILEPVQDAGVDCDCRVGEPQDVDQNGLRHAEAKRAENCSSADADRDGEKVQAKTNDDQQVQETQQTKKPQQANMLKSTLKSRKQHKHISRPITNPEAHVYLSKKIHASDLRQAGSTKDIEDSINRIENIFFKKLSLDINVEQSYFDEIDNLKTQLIQESKEIHLESLILRMLKESGEEVITDRTLAIVKDLPIVKNKEIDSKIFENISKQVVGKNPENIDIKLELHNLQQSKPSSRNPFFNSNFFEVQVEGIRKDVRKNLIKSASELSIIDAKDSKLEKAINIQEEISIFKKIVQDTKAKDELVEQIKTEKKQDSIHIKVRMPEYRKTTVRADQEYGAGQSESRSRAEPQAQQINSSINENHSIHQNQREALKLRINDIKLNEASGPKSLGVIIGQLEDKIKVEDEIETGADKDNYIKELNRLKEQLSKETQEIYEEAVMLRLLKKAGKSLEEKGVKNENIAAEALTLIKKSSAIKSSMNEEKVLNMLDRISQSCSNQDIQSIDIESQLQELQRNKNLYHSDLVDTDKIRANAIKLSSSSKRMDKEDTGFKNTIIIDNNNNLIALKNSVIVGDASEPLSLRLLMKKKKDMNYDKQKRKIKYEDRTRIDNKAGKQRIKGILGKGGFGKVRMGQDVLTGEPIAVKKMNRIAYAEQEAKEKQRLIRALAIPADIKYFLPADNIAISHGKNGDQKAYLTSKLQGKDGFESIRELYDLKTRGGSVFEQGHGHFILKTMATLEALGRNNIVHGDLKWGNMIGGKIADLDGLCYKVGDPLGAITLRYLPPDIKLQERNGRKDYVHSSEEQYKKHNSFAFGIMLLESIDPGAKQLFPLKVKSSRFSRPVEGYTNATQIPPAHSHGTLFTDYEKDVIKLAYRLADTEPENRPTIADAKIAMEAICAKHGISIRE